jgi:hypothetical protein
LGYPDQKQKVRYFTAYQVPVTEHNLYLYIRQRFVLRGIIVVKDWIVYFRYMHDVGLSTIVGGSPLDGFKIIIIIILLYACESLTTGVDMLATGGTCSTTKVHAILLGDIHNE